MLLILDVLPLHYHLAAVNYDAENSSEFFIKRLLCYTSYCDVSNAVCLVYHTTNCIQDIRVDSLLKIIHQNDQTHFHSLLRYSCNI